MNVDPKELRKVTAWALDTADLRLIRDAAAELDSLRAENERFKADLTAAMGELLVPLPVAGTDMARTVSANAILRAELARLRAQVEAAKWRDTEGGKRIAAERQRQVDAEGYDADHDDEHCDGELGRAALAYECSADGVHAKWPRNWEPCYFKPKGKVADLERAGALYLAERDRIDRRLTLVAQDLDAALAPEPKEGKPLFTRCAPPTPKHPPEPEPSQFVSVPKCIHCGKNMAAFSDGRCVVCHEIKPPELEKCLTCGGTEGRHTSDCPQYSGYKETI